MLWEEVKDAFPGPEIAASVIQKFGVAKINKNSYRYDVINTKGYKAMLWRVKEKVGSLNDKALIDTVYAIAWLHREDRSVYPSFFEHVL